jgi:hypothetical protein
MCGRQSVANVGLWFAPGGAIRDATKPPDASSARPREQFSALHLSLMTEVDACARGTWQVGILFAAGHDGAGRVTRDASEPAYGDFRLVMWREDTELNALLGRDTITGQIARDRRNHSNPSVASVTVGNCVTARQLGSMNHALLL